MGRLRRPGGDGRLRRQGGLWGAFGAWGGMGAFGALGGMGAFGARGGLWGAFGALGGGWAPSAPLGPKGPFGVIPELFRADGCSDWTNLRIELLELENKAWNASWDGPPSALSGDRFWQHSRLGADLAWDNLREGPPVIFATGSLAERGLAALQRQGRGRASLLAGHRHRSAQVATHGNTWHKEPGFGAKEPPPGTPLSHTRKSNDDVTTRKNEQLRIKSFVGIQIMKGFGFGAKEPPPGTE